MLLARCVDVFEEDLFMFRFFSFQREGNLQRCEDVFDILITSKGASDVTMF